MWQGDDDPKADDDDTRGFLFIFSFTGTMKKIVRVSMCGCHYSLTFCCCDKKTTAGSAAAQTTIRSSYFCGGG